MLGLGACAASSDVVLHGRQLQATVGSPAGLKQALDDGVGHVVLEEGVYDLTSGMTEMCSSPYGGGMLCLDYAVTIEAEVAGTVVLDALRGNRVVHIDGAGIELVGRFRSGEGGSRSRRVEERSAALPRPLPPPRAPPRQAGS